MYFRVLFTLIFALCATQALGIDFSNSKWIWTNEVNVAKNAPTGDRAFRRDISTPSGKTALSAKILIGADDAYTLYVNGNEVGSGNTWTQAATYCVRLTPDYNLFAVKATNGGSIPNPAGLLATIEIQYTDGSIDTIVTDDTWHYSTSVPDGFQLGGFDDSAWKPAVVEGNYGVSPWNVIAVPSSASITPLKFTDANWIWTNEVNSAGIAPIGARAFRKDYVLPAGHHATSATIVIAVDDDFTVYLRGSVVGSGRGAYRVAQRFVVDIWPPASDISLAIYASNGGGPAGIILAVELAMEDYECGLFTSFVSDATWKFNTTTPAEFEFPGYDDSAWGYAVVEGKYGEAAWGNVSVNSTISLPSGPLPGAPIGHVVDVSA